MCVNNSTNTIPRKRYRDAQMLNHLTYHHFYFGKKKANFPFRESKNLENKQETSTLEILRSWKLTARYSREKSIRSSHKSHRAYNPRINGGIESFLFPDGLRWIFLSGWFSQQKLGIKIIPRLSLSNSMAAFLSSFDREEEKERERGIPVSPKKRQPWDPFRGVSESDFVGLVT